MEYTDMKELVEYGLDEINVDEKILVEAKDFMYLYRTLEEFMRFFYQPDHYKSLEDVKEFLGNKNSNEGFDVLSTAIYDVLYNIKLPKELEEMIYDSKFESDKVPYYYKAKDK